MKMEWNAGGWFGSQLGGSAWVLVAAVLAAMQDLQTGIILLAVFLLPNIAGYVFWRRRRLSCYASTQFLLALLGVSGLLAIFFLERAKLWQAIQVGSAVSAGSSYIVLALIIIILMLTFYLRFGRD